MPGAFVLFWNEIAFVSNYSFYAIPISLEELIKSFYLKEKPLVD